MQTGGEHIDPRRIRLVIHAKHDKLIVVVGIRGVQDNGLAEKGHGFGSIAHGLVSVGCETRQLGVLPVCRE